MNFVTFYSTAMGTSNSYSYWFIIISFFVQNWYRRFCLLYGIRKSIFYYSKFNSSMAISMARMWNKEFNFRSYSLLSFSLLFFTLYSKIYSEKDICEDYTLLSNLFCCIFTFKHLFKWIS